MSKINYSELESKRFNKEIFRGSLDVLDIFLLQDFFAQHDPDITILRIPVAEQHKMHVLNQLNKDVINADTLVYYQVDLNKTSFNPIRNKQIDFMRCDASSKSIFAELIPKIFIDYTNHYFSNPALEKKKITEGYIEWAVNTIEAPDNLHILAYVNNLPVGFITCSYNSNFAEIILNGVLPERQGEGIYSDMVRYVKDYFSRLKIPILKVSTQIQNFAVQKVWNREGLVLSSAYVTFHLNKKGIL